MGYSPEKAKLLPLLRKHVRGVMDWGKGTCGTTFERVVGFVCRAALRRLTGEEAALLETTVPAWMTKAWVEELTNTSTAASPSPAAQLAQEPLQAARFPCAITGRFRHRVIDRYFTENKEGFVTKAAGEVERHSTERRHIVALARRHAAHHWNMLPKNAQT